MTRIPPPVQYSLLLFVPLLVPLLLPVPCLGAQCVLLTSIQVAEPSSLDPGGHAGFCAWALGPLLGAAIIFLLGLLAHRLTGANGPPPRGRAAVWAMFSLAAFPVAWYLLILVTSIGATETPPVKYLGITAWMAAAVLALGQPLILLWLSLVERFWGTRRAG